MATTNPNIQPFTTFAWDFDSDGVADATTSDPTVTHAIRMTPTSWRE